MSALGTILVCLLFTLVQSKPSNIDLEIIGGNDVKIEDVGYQASIRLQGAHICGGSIVGDVWVLTTASCVDGYSSNSLSVYGGNVELYGDDKAIAITDITLHKEYNSTTLENNVAVLKLKEAIAKSKAIDLVSESDQLNDKATVIVTGWGATEEGGDLSNSLKKVELNLLSDDDCVKYYRTSFDSQTMFCTIANEKGDACYGDAGGSLVQDSKLFGLVSWGIGCGRAEYPRVYTKLSAVRSFIDEAMKS